MQHVLCVCATLGAAVGVSSEGQAGWPWRTLQSTVWTVRWGRAGRGELNSRGLPGGGRSWLPSCDRRSVHLPPLGREPCRTPTTLFSNYCTPAAGQRAPRGDSLALGTTRGVTGGQHDEDHPCLQTSKLETSHKCLARVAQLLRLGAGVGIQVQLSSSPGLIPLRC